MAVVITGTAIRGKSTEDILEELLEEEEAGPFAPVSSAQETTPMSSIVSSPSPWLTDTVRWWCYRLSRTFERFQRAVQYATGHLSADNAQHIMLDCCFGAGWHPLQILDVQETLAEAREIFTDHPALPHLIAAACSRVASKWEGNGDDSHEARRWAIEIAEEYAAHTNIKLIRWTDVLPPE